MKSLWIAIALAAVSIAATEANAQSLPLPQLECPTPNDHIISHGGVYATLDTSIFDEGSGFAAIRDVRILYNFSSVSDMICNDYVSLDKIEATCLGFYSSNEETKVVFAVENGETIAHWNLSEVYGGGPVRSVCTLKK